MHYDNIAVNVKLFLRYNLYYYFSSISNKVMLSKYIVQRTVHNIDLCYNFAQCI